MSCGCKELYCIHAWEAVRPEDFIPDSDLYAYADAHITQEPTWETLVMSKCPGGHASGFAMSMCPNYNPKYIKPISKISLTYAKPAPSPIAQEKQSLWNPKDGWTLRQGEVYNISWTGIDISQNGGRTRVEKTLRYIGKNSTHILFTQKTSTHDLLPEMFEVQLSDGSWYYPWPESDSGFEKEKQAEYSCAHKPVNIGFMSQKWVCAHCDAELDAETAIKLGGKV